MSALESALDGVDALLVVARKSGLDPVYHVPSNDDPSRPLCNKNDGSGKGYREADVDPRDLDESQFCGSCMGLDKTSNHRRRLDLLLADEEITSIEDARRALEESDL